MRSLAMGAIAIALTLCAPLELQADSWSRTPDGRIGYTFGFEATVTLSCGGRYVVGSCAVFGDAIRISNGGNSLVLRFRNSSPTSVTAYNVRESVGLGQLEVEVEGDGPFVLPTMSHPNNSLFQAAIALSTTSPSVRSKTKTIGFYGRNGVFNPTSRFSRNVTWMSFGLADQPPEYHYRSVVFDNFPYRAIAPEDAVIQWNTDVGIVPEPGSILLVATGMLGLLAVSRRRRNT